MADFHIRGHVRHQGPGNLVATVTAMPVGDSHPSSWEVIEEACSTSDAAASALQRLTVEMGQRILQRGDEVMTVESHDNE